MGGIVAGFSVHMIVRNAVPILLFSLLIVLGLWKAEQYLIKWFEIWGKMISAIATLGLAAAGVELTTGYVLILGMASMEEAFGIVGEIAIVLSGAFPLLAMLTGILQKPITQIGDILNMNNTSVSGLLANSIATFEMLVFGDHLAFT